MVYPDTDSLMDGSRVSQDCALALGHPVRFTQDTEAEGSTILSVGHAVLGVVMHSIDNTRWHSLWQAGHTWTLCQPTLSQEIFCLIIGSDRRSIFLLGSAVNQWDYPSGPSDSQMRQGEQ